MNRGSDLPGEFELIPQYFAPLAKGFPGAYGLLDDAAIIAPAPGHELVAKTDAIVGGVHFLPDDPPDLVGRKALRVNLSDLAAKGAVARAYMLDLILPNTIGEAWIAGFAPGLARDQHDYSVHLIGGARPRGATWRTPRARHTIGRIFRRALPLAVTTGHSRSPIIGLATASLDVSDGLIADLGHICEISDLTAIIEAPRVPLSAPARLAITARPIGWLPFCRAATIMVPPYARSL